MKKKKEPIGYYEYKVGETKYFIHANNKDHEVNEDVYKVWLDLKERIGELEEELMMYIDSHPV